MGPLVWMVALLALDPVEEAREVLERCAKEAEEQPRREEAIALLGRIGSIRSTRLLEALLADPFPHIRDEAEWALTRCDAPSRAFLAEALARRSDGMTRSHLARALGRIRDRSTLPALLDALAIERDPALLPHLASAIGQFDEPAGLLALTEKAHRFPPGRAACIAGASAFPAAPEWALLYRADADDAVRAAVVDMLALHGREVLPDLESMDGVGERKGIALAEALPKGRGRALVRRRAAALLGHPSWRVRAAAISAVAALHDASLLPDLRARLEVEEGRLSEDLRAAMQRIDPRGGAGAEPEGRFAGVPLASERIAIVVDLPGEVAAAGFGGWLASLRERQLIDLFRAEDPGGFPPRVEVRRAFGGLMPPNADACVRWIAGQRGPSALFDALAAAVEEEGIDTLCILSDGRMRRGSLRSCERLCAEIERRNRWRRIRIHALLVGGDVAVPEPLERLARGTGGSAKLLR